jgi:cell division protein ZapA
LPEVSVDINGRKYRMACEEGQEDHLRQLAETFAGYVDNLKGDFGEAGDNRLTIMAGITVLDELRELKGRIGALEAELQEITAAGAALTDEQDALERDYAARFGALADRINALAAELEDAEEHRG